jgi:hypothetical protein
MIHDYYYNQQIRSYIVQVANVFAGLEVRTGKGANGQIEMMNVPVHYGSEDRVVASLGSGYTQNKPYTLPMMSTYVTGIELTPDRRKGIGVIDRKTTLPVGGMFPDDLVVVERIMPVPYNLEFEVSAYCSNTDQAFQIIEQILILFDPILQIQTSDKDFDWTKLTTMELLSIQNEEVYPSGTEKRIIIWSFSFAVPIWISAPMNIKSEIVKAIKFRIGAYDEFSLLEYDDEGDLVPFGDPSLDVGKETFTVPNN